VKFILATFYTANPLYEVIRGGGGGGEEEEEE